ncbi:MAG: hypothetical protein ACOYVD_16985 [Bacillota bacterium]
MNTLPVKKECLDAATEKCPCEAAITKDCPVCSVLNYGTNCDCSHSWQGVCIYQDYLQAGPIVSQKVTEKIEIVQKLILDNCVKIICYIPCDILSTLQPFQGVKLSLESNKKKLTFNAVTAKIVYEKNLATFVINDTNYEIPLKYSFILDKGMNISITAFDRVLPALPLEEMKNVLIAVDGFWLGLVNPIIEALKNNNIKITLAGPFSRVTLNKLNLTEADKVISHEGNPEYLKGDYDTIVSLNTPSLQKRIVSTIWKEKIEKKLIAVNNDFL